MERKTITDSMTGKTAKREGKDTKFLDGVLHVQRSNEDIFKSRSTIIM